MHSSHFAMGPTCWQSTELQSSCNQAEANAMTRALPPQTNTALFCCSPTSVTSNTEHFVKTFHHNLTFCIKQPDLFLLSTMVSSWQAVWDQFWLPSTCVSPLGASTHGQLHLLNLHANWALLALPKSPYLILSFSMERSTITRVRSSTTCLSTPCCKAANGTHWLRPMRMSSKLRCTLA